MKNYCKCTHYQAIQDVDEFVFIQTDFEKLALYHLLTTGSSAVNVCH